ncbi:TPA: GspH/FimT family pseudopilin [Vibrio vulnificus]|nr:GspH/FimT family pseudopilin [Vibrio vulnificus]
MTRGFTLLELLITVAVLAVVLASAAPSFTRVTNTTKMQRLGNELHGFVIQAKSEAVLRRQNLWAHISIAANGDSLGTWKIELTDNATPGIGTVLLNLSGAPYKGVLVKSQFPSDQISFDGVYGRPSQGNIRFYPTGESTKAIKLIAHNRSARFRLCSDNQSDEYYGYPRC